MTAQQTTIDTTERDDETSLDVIESAESTDSAAGGVDDASTGVTTKSTRRTRWAGILAFGVIPVLALLVAAAAGYLKWQHGQTRDGELAAAESLRAARDSAIALLSYQPDTVEQTLRQARDRLTGSFKDSYTSLTDDVVIPGAKEKRIAATATIAAAAPISVRAGHAQVLLYVNQTVTVGNGPPSDTASTVKVTLDKVDGRWLISGFDPI